MSSKKCPKCGAKLKDTAMKCSKCGYVYKKHSTANSKRKKEQKRRARKRMQSFVVIFICVCLIAVGYLIWQALQSDNTTLIDEQTRKSTDIQERTQVGTSTPTATKITSMDSLTNIEDENKLTVINPFYIFDGITFGMNYSEIAMNETSQLMERDATSASFGPFTMFGIPNCQTYYYFSNGHMTFCDISIGKNLTPELAKSDYRNMQSILEKTYGKPLDDEGKKTYKLSGSMEETIMEITEHAVKNGFYGECDDSVWAIDIGYGIAKIEHYYYAVDYGELCAAFHDINFYCLPYNE